MRRLEEFRGDWRLRRRILDRRAGEVARLDGVVRFVAAADGLRQDEAGTLRLPGRPPLSATRAYLWSERPDRIMVDFADGTRFHDFGPALCTPTAEHPCGDDLYRVRYDFRRWPRWRIVWRVSGPRKDLVIVSSLAPLASMPGSGQNDVEAETE